MFDFLKKKDPICGMKEEKGTGTHKHGKWFCSDNCVEEYEKGSKDKKGSCCGGH